MRGSWFLDRLECPDCGTALVAGGSERPLHCSGCGREFPVRGDQVSCTPSADRSTHLDVPVLQNTPQWPRWTPPPTAYHGPLSARTNRRHLAILEASSGARDVLDWGCGTAEYRPLVQDVLGRRYVGFDVAGDDADVLGDAHRLPFRAASFDHVLTSAVLEHVANPFVAVREVARVLRPGGVFSGSVAFLEPYHANSFFHLTADAVVHVLGTAGLDVEGIWPQEGWSVFDSLATMPGPVSAVSRRGLRLLASWERVVRNRHLHPRALRGGRWLRRRTEEERHRELLAVTGQVDFCARKP